jgi:hypothetical protein
LGGFLSSFSVSVFSRGFDGLDVLSVLSIGVNSDGPSVGTLETAGAALRPELTSAIRTYGRCLDMLNTRPQTRINTYLDVEVDRNDFSAV